MIKWTIQQRADVASALQEHPSTSDRCARAAEAIIPTARQVDSDAHALIIEPQDDGALYIQPKNISSRWFYHVTASVVQHCVDVLTGPDGHERSHYLDQLFIYPEAHRMRRVESEELSTL